MKRFAISVGALCAIMLWTAACTTPEFDNPLDPRGDNYLYGDPSNEGCKHALFTGGCVESQTPTFSLATYASPSAGGVVLPPAAIQDSGRSVTAVAIPNAGYVFMEWMGAPASVDPASPYITFDMHDNVMLIANFRPENTGPTPTVYALETNVDPQEGGEITREPNSPTYEAGTQVTVTATPRSGYDFVSWTGTGGLTSTSAEFTFRVNEEMTLTANFRQHLDILPTYTLTTRASPAEGGNVVRTPNATSFDEGTRVTVVAIPSSAEYVFTGWSGAPEGVDASSESITFNLNANTMLTANFQRVQQITTHALAVSRNLPAGGNVDVTIGSSLQTDPSSQQVVAGTTVILNARAAAGYTFQNWTAVSGSLPTGISATNASISFVMNGNVSIRANFLQDVVIPPPPTWDGYVTRFETGEYHNFGVGYFVFAFDEPDMTYFSSNTQFEQGGHFWPYAGQGRNSGAAGGIELSSMPFWRDWNVPAPELPYYPGWGMGICLPCVPEVGGNIASFNDYYNVRLGTGANFADVDTIVFWARTTQTNPIVSFGLSVLTTDNYSPDGRSVNSNTYVVYFNSSHAGTITSGHNINAPARAPAISSSWQRYAIALKPVVPLISYSDGYSLDPIPGVRSSIVHPEPNARAGDLKQEDYHGAIFTFRPERVTNIQWRIRSQDQPAGGTNSPTALYIDDVELKGRNFKYNPPEAQ